MKEYVAYSRKRIKDQRNFRDVPANLGSGRAKPRREKFKEIDKELG